MADRPIILSGPEVRAILEGRKTQTRRVLKPQPPGGTDHFYRTPSTAVDGGRWIACLNSGMGLKNYGTRGPGLRIPIEGDRLWVKETFRGARGYDNNPPSKWGNKPIWYEADGEPDLNRWWQLSDRCRPSIHMPRWASRITLVVTDVRIQRVQDISASDAVAEGVVPAHQTALMHCYGPACPTDPVRSCKIRGCWGIRESFRDLWDSLNAKSGYGWEANPWVVVRTFEREAVKDE